MSNGQTFNPREHLINIKNGKGVSEYLEVKWRLVWFRQECPQGTITTEVLHLDLDKDVEVEAFAWNAEKRRSEKVLKTAKGVAVFRATVADGKGGSATGTKSENAANFADFIEKAESGSIGRALAALGYGTQFTGDELNEKERIVDAPVERPTNGSNASQGQQDQSSGQAPRTGNAQNNGITTPSSAATEQQIASIKKLCQHLEKPEPDSLSNMAFLDAKQLLQQLTEEYRVQKQNRAHPNNGVNGPQPSAQQQGNAPAPTSSISAPTPSKLRKRCDEVFGPGKWETLMSRVLNAVVPQDNLTPEDCNALKQAMDNAERNRQPKAS